MKPNGEWKNLSRRQKLLILFRDIPLYVLILSVVPGLLTGFDNSLPVLICLPLSCLSQAILSWKRDKITAGFFLLGGFFVIVFYCFSKAG